MDISCTLFFLNFIFIRFSAVQALTEELYFWMPIDNTQYFIREVILLFGLVRDSSVFIGNVYICHL